jgi:LytS/YehU family sensor histidine kinase
VLGYIGYFGSAVYVMLSWSALYFGAKFARSLARERESALAANAMAHQAQLRMLRYQLNPHFLFNTLNAISTLVLDGRRETANGMVGALSGFLRYSLDSDPEQRVTLNQEIESVRRYLGIEQVRFGDRLRVGILVTPEAGSALVPSLILQPLIENAIKFAVSRREEGGHIELVARAEEGVLEISLRDDGPGSDDYVPKSGGGHGVGLANTRERLRVLYGDEQSFTIRTCAPRGTLVTLRLPLERADEDIAHADTHAYR